MAYLLESFNVHGETRSHDGFCLQRIVCGFGEGSRVEPCVGCVGDLQQGSEAVSKRAEHICNCFWHRAKKRVVGGQSGEAHMMRSENSRGTSYSLDDETSSVPVRVRPKKTSSRKSLPRIVSLFSGAGGLDLGFKDAGFTISVAIDVSDAAIGTHRKNFPRVSAVVGDLIKLQPTGVLEHVKKKLKPGQRIAVIGGPPCQGFSRANTSSLSNDPRNMLPKLYLEVVAELQKLYTVEFIVFENVLGIRDKKHVRTYKELMQGISDLGFDVTEKELCSADFGVPQNRRRIVLSGMRAGQGYTGVKPRKRKGLQTVREAIGGLAAPTFFKHGLNPKDFPVHPNHWTMQPKSPRFLNPDAETGDGRSFKRLKWDSASPTIAFGHREIHIHPDGHRRLSIYEALLLQGFPEAFVLEGNLSEQVEQVSNAVPPPLARSVASAVKRALNGR